MEEITGNECFKVSISGSIRIRIILVVEVVVNDIEKWDLNHKILFEEREGSKGLLMYELNYANVY